MAVDSPTFDASTVAATAAITATVTILIQRGIGTLWDRLFRDKRRDNLEKRLLSWRQEGDELEAELTKKRLSLERMEGLLQKAAKKKDT